MLLDELIAAVAPLIKLTLTNQSCTLIKINFNKDQVFQES